MTARGDGDDSDVAITVGALDGLPDVWGAAYETHPGLGAAAFSSVHLRVAPSTS
jgi:hypothetical protein